MNGYSWKILNNIYGWFGSNSTRNIDRNVTDSSNSGDLRSDADVSTDTNSSMISSTSMIFDIEDILNGLITLKSNCPRELLQLIAEFSVPSCLVCKTSQNLRNNGICTSCYLSNNICSLCYAKRYKDENDKISKHSIEWQNSCEYCSKVLCDDCAIDSTFQDSEEVIICPDCRYLMF